MSNTLTQSHIQSLIDDGILILNEANLRGYITYWVDATHTTKITELSDYTVDDYSINPEYVLNAHTKKLVHVVESLRVVTAYHGDSQSPAKGMNVGDCVFYNAGKSGDKITSYILQLHVMKRDRIISI